MQQQAAPPGDGVEQAEVDHERTRGGGEAVFCSFDFHLRALVLLASFPMELQGLQRTRVR